MVPARLKRYWRCPPAGPGRSRLVVGFAAETHDVLAYAVAKQAHFLNRKGELTILIRNGEIGSDGFRA